MDTNSSLLGLSLIPEGKTRVVMGDQPKAPDAEAISAQLVPDVYHTEKTVVAQAGGRRVLRVAACATDNPDEMALFVAPRETCVAMGQFLIRDLLTGISIPTALAGVDDLFAAVFVINVSARDHNRLCTILAPANAALEGTVYAGGGKFPAVDKC